MGWRREELWFDAEDLWLDAPGAPPVPALVLPPLPSFGAVGLAASRERREAWKRRRRARATALMVLPAVMVPPALIRSGGAGAGVLPEDPPSLTVRLPEPDPVVVKRRPVAPKRQALRREASPKIDWHNATSRGLWFDGSLLDGTQLPVEGPDWVTWNPNTDSVPNASHRLYGNERTIRTVVSVLAAYRAAHPRAPRVVVGDISFEHGGPMDAHLSHQNGLDVDIYYPRRDGRLREPRTPDQVDRRLSQDLLDRFLAAGAHMVFVGYQTGLRGPRDVVVPYPKHENHMHVRFPARSG